MSLDIHANVLQVESETSSMRNQYMAFAITHYCMLEEDLAVLHLRTLLTGGCTETGFDPPSTGCKR